VRRCPRGGVLACGAAAAAIADDPAVLAGLFEE